jgi:hypothetical protein
MTPPINIDGTQVQDITIDGQSVSEVTMDGDQVFGSTIPDSVVHQYVAENFATPWPNDVGAADMSVNGLSASTFTNGGTSVTGDGSSDYGNAAGPQNIPQNETFGIAFTAEFSANTGGHFFGATDSGFTRLNVRQDSLGAGGNVGIQIQDDNGNELRVYTDSTFEGDERAIIINKNGNDTSQINIYVDDMSSAQSQSVDDNDAFDHSNYTCDKDLHFWARVNNDATISGYTDADMGILEFRSEPYSQSEREGFVERRPEV